MSVSILVKTIEDDERWDLINELVEIIKQQELTVLEDIECLFAFMQRTLEKNDEEIKILNIYKIIRECLIINQWEINNQIQKLLKQIMINNGGLFQKVREESSILLIMLIEITNERYMVLRLLIETTLRDNQDRVVKQCLPLVKVLLETDKGCLLDKRQGLQLVINCLSLLLELTKARSLGVREEVKSILRTIKVDGWNRAVEGLQEEQQKYYESIVMKRRENKMNMYQKYNGLYMNIMNEYEMGMSMQEGDIKGKVEVLKQIRKRIHKGKGMIQIGNWLQLQLTTGESTVILQVFAIMQLLIGMESFLVTMIEDNYIGLLVDLLANTNKQIREGAIHLLKQLYSANTFNSYYVRLQSLLVDGSMNVYQEIYIMRLQMVILVRVQLEDKDSNQIGDRLQWILKGLARCYDRQQNDVKQAAHQLMAYWLYIRQDTASLLLDISHKTH